MPTIRNLEICDYQEVWQKMRDFTDNRNTETPDEIWLLEHFPVFTQGQAGKPEHILNPGDIPVIQTDRGGQVTYHGPGQLMVYPLIDLRRQKIGVKKFVNILEQTVIELLADYDIKAVIKPNAPGVYVNHAKIASIGLKVKHGCSYHGIALNVDMDLEPFSRINPCGFQDLKMTQISDFVDDVDITEIKRKIGKIYSNRFHGGGETPPLHKPHWIRSQLPSKDKIGKTENLLRENHLVTVCEEAACPNRGECFNCGTATFMIMGDICTRNCRFCNVRHGKPEPLDAAEPQKLARTIKTMGLSYVVLTSVDRDDLADDGAKHFVVCIDAIRKLNPGVKIEILTPDFKGCMVDALDILAKTHYDVFNHNIETVPRLYKTICPSANYQRSLDLLLAHKERFPDIPTKTGLMLGLGETDAEVEEVMAELRDYKVERLTLGQYLQPTKNHLPVARYVTPARFDEFAQLAKDLGFTHVASGPMVRSSYYAAEQAT